MKCLYFTVYGYGYEFFTGTTFAMKVVNKGSQDKVALVLAFHGNIFRIQLSKTNISERKTKLLQDRAEVAQSCSPFLESITKHIL